MVFSSIYPVASDEYQSLADALEKYKLNDAALVYTKDSSAALGQGFRCGFLGLLHLDIVQERLEREYDQSLIMTTPSVRYDSSSPTAAEVAIDNPQFYPDPVRIKKAFEPYIRASHHHPGTLHGRGHEALPGAPGGQLHLQLPVPGAHRNPH